MSKLREYFQVAKPLNFSVSALLGSFFVILISAHPALAQLVDVDIQGGVSDIAKNVVDSADQVPALIASLAYLMGLIVGTTGILKIKDHIEQPTQTPMRVGIIRLLIGGALFSLPTVYEVMFNTITGGGEASFDSEIFSPATFFSGIMGEFTGLFGDITLYLNLNAVINAIYLSLKDLPGIISSAAYILGLIMGVHGLLKLKDHVENPDQNPLKEGVIRLIIGAAFLAIPTIFTAMAAAISGGDSTTGAMGIIAGLVDGFGVLESGYNGRGCTGDSLGAALDGLSFGLLDTGGNSLGSALCAIVTNTGTLPAILNVFSYLFGLVLGFMALLKIRDHVLNPQQTPLSQGLSRLAAGGAFFSFPIIIEMVRATVTPASTTGAELLSVAGIGGTTTGYNVDGIDCEAGGSITSLIDDLTSSIDLGGFLGFDGGGGGGEGAADVSSAGLDGRLYCAVSDVLGPLHSVINFFTLVAGMIFVMIGISRLLKSEQDGPKGPGGIGTIMTFITAGVLISFSDFIRIFTSTIFNDPQTKTQGVLQYTTGMNPTEIAHAEMVIAAVLKFMIMIGLISFARGIFIIRSLAEGNNQASLMAGVTHMVGGALAVNLGPLMNAVQLTLGIESIGIAFS